VGDHQRRAPFEDAGQRLLDQGLGLCVLCGCGLVEHQYRGVFEERARQGQALALAAGKVIALLAQAGCEARRQAFDKGQGVGLRERLAYRCLVGAGQLAVGDVLGNRAGKQGRLLTHDGDLAAQRRQAQ
jgi:hypothetical protein